MLWQETLHSGPYLFAVLLVSLRLGAAVLALPIADGRLLSFRMRLLFVFCLAAVAGPLQQPPAHADILAIIPIAGRELLVGMTFGLANRLLLAGLQISTSIVGQISGIPEEPTDDVMGEARWPLQKFTDLVGVTVFLVMGGHRVVIDFVLESYQVLPLGTAWDTVQLSELAGTMLRESFEFGLQLALPLILAILASSVLLGFLSRIAPQLNVWAIGYSANSLLILAASCAGLAAIAGGLRSHLPSMLDHVVAATPAVPTASSPPIDLHTPQR
ncbi:MAG: flagellar biosynthetic protein FliR [Planctomycetales bacterium]|nr:flagellar biosynthetic protein FliR [Planctomycetales bacterium]